RRQVLARGVQPGRRPRQGAGQGQGTGQQDPQARAAHQAAVPDVPRARGREGRHSPGLTATARERLAKRGHDMATTEPGTNRTGPLAGTTATAAILEELDAPLQLHEVEIDAPRENEV